MQHLLTLAAISVFVVFSALAARSDDVKPDHITIDLPAISSAARG